MRRKYDSMERRNRRFLFPLVELTLPALAVLYMLYEIPSAICGLASIQATKAQCTFSVPAIAVTALTVLAFAGLVGTGWRFYKDYVCHERFDGIL
jgi:hypothetical protein